jgi:hypothetical protein
MAKLSPKMQAVLNSLVNAPYYYMAEGKMLDYLHTPEGSRGWGGQASAAHIVTKDRVVIRECTSTLKALEKRGLIEILELGGAYLDCVRVPGVQYTQPITEARKIVFTITRYSDYSHRQTTHTHTHYALEGVDIESSIKNIRPGWDITHIEDRGLVGLAVWDYKLYGEEAK